jgi:YfiH family protein
VVIPEQTHSNLVETVDTRIGPDLRCDGLLTQVPSMMIGVSVADCIPLLAVNMVDRVLGVAHCGWRGMASGIIENFCASIKRRTRQPEKTYFLIGASIGSCCYEVGEDMLARFAPHEVSRFSASRGGKTFFDLKSLAAWRLLKQGIPRRQISVDNTCTSCQKYILCSYRASGDGCGRMLAFVMRKE